ncbi:MAG: DUF6516 family protein [Methylobacillus sp.]|jgi:hypothetical protein|nr:DUF6516 family protein [Methylobacillus sp.]
MKAKASLLQKERFKLSESAFAEVVIWQLEVPLAGSRHSYKYRLAYVVDEVCELRYDNEIGKGDHKHESGCEIAYTFTTLAQLEADFWADIDRLEG